jgi:hypothetical protein
MRNGEGSCLKFWRCLNMIGYHLSRFLPLVTRKGYVRIRATAVAALISVFLASATF